MADEKSIIKKDKMIHKKTGASFLVVYVIYVSLVYADSKRTASCLLRRHTIFATFGRQLKCLLVHIQGGLYLFHYVLDNLNLLLFVYLSNLIINSITLYNVCSVHRGMFSTFGGVQYIRGIPSVHGGYHEYIGGCSVHWGDTISTSGDIISTSGDIMSTSGDIISTSGDIMILVGGGAASW